MNVNSGSMAAADVEGRPTCPHVDGRPYDPLDPDVVANPWPWLDAAQEQRPIFWMPQQQAWCVTTHAAARKVLLDPSTFSSRKVIRLPALDAQFEDAFPEGNPMDRVLVSLDPPEHNRLRRLAQRAFTDHLVDARQGAVRNLCDRLIDGFPATGPVDLVSEYGVHLPVQAITDIVGAPIERAEEFRQWAADRISMLAGAPAMDEAERAALVARASSFNGWLHEFVEDRRRSPRQDLTSALVQATGDDGEPKLTNGEIIALIATILSAGASTTAHFIPVAVRELLRHPSTWADLKQDRARVPQVVEELLRLVTSVHMVIRTATKNTEVEGIPIAEGEDLYIHYSAAQRDGEVFPDPHTFDPDRDNLNKHFAFGRGIHLCLGAPLARLETVVTIEALLDRLPELRLVEGQPEEWEPHLLTPGLKQLLVDW